MEPSQPNLPSSAFQAGDLVLNGSQWQGKLKFDEIASRFYPTGIIRKLAMLLMAFSLLFQVACKPEDTIAPELIPLAPIDTLLIFGETFSHPSFEVIDNRPLGEEGGVWNPTVTTNRIGLQEVQYRTVDANGNEGFFDVTYNVIFEKDSWWNESWQATDTCEGASYSYEADLLDCTCPDNQVVSSNLGNFGPSTFLTWNLDGDFNEKAAFLQENGGITFRGNATMSEDSRSISLEFEVSNGASSQSCISRWERPVN